MIKIVVESGADLDTKKAKELGIEIVPMHFVMDDNTYDEGELTPDKVCEYYEKTKNVPKTSGCTPIDFMRKFEEIHEKWPDAKILHLAYSSDLSCCYNSAEIAREDMDYVTVVDTKLASMGQGLLAVKAAEFINKFPQVTMDKLVEFINDVKTKVKMFCIPDKLNYLKAGGRLSNSAAFLGGMMNIHPVIEFINGKLVATKKIRGSMKMCLPKFLEDMLSHGNFDKEDIWLNEGPGFAEDLKKSLENIAKKFGFKNVNWVKTGCVITIHGGPEHFAATAIEA